MTAPQPGLVDRLGPVGIAAIATGVLVLFGMGAVIIPALTDGEPSTSNAQPAAPETVVEQAGEPISASPPQSASPAGKPSSAAPTLVSANFNANYEDRVVQLVNNERRKEKCEPVRMNAQLRTTARAHSADMAVNNVTGSRGSDGSDPAARAKKAGYSEFADELTARGGDAGDVVKGWLRNDNDRDVLVDCDIRSIGVGAAMRGRTAYWTVDTGRA
ncbi:hypothetical protein GCM10010399_38780 [Dactylosporangium fulvum]|uniref:CAP domain-containing protein n=1 Tax=Dactylosporangium fulvum TaxID=53359 RepID=A0ABY5W239_9ACTN|nr:CAP domain-containing protein [Dactylosporangium fulvum]UWP84113.1 CAP domain-containing protein [Dactylosporangium fulvum]